MKTTEDFLKEAREIHGDKYEYDLSNYQNRNTKIRIFCKECQEWFLMTPKSHINKKAGHKKCALRKRFQLGKEEFIKKANLIHNFKYDYSLTNYVNSKTKIKIICKKCGVIFEQVPLSHLKGIGCPKCGAIKCRITQTKSAEDFLTEARKIHGDKYEYDLSTYQNRERKIRIICPKHGEFFQAAFKHLTGQGCPNCSKSKGENLIKNYLNSKGINFIPNKTFPDLRDIGLLSYDFYIKEKNLLIEFNGIQHYKSIEHFGGIKTFHKQLHHDWLKRRYARKNNINLLVIKYNEDAISCLESKLDFLTKK